MPSRQITDLCDELQPLACQFISIGNGDQLFKNAGAELFLTCTYRSGAEQNALYAQGRTKKGQIVTKARAGQSPHNCLDKAGNPAAKAFDFAIRLPTGKLDWDATSPLWRRAIAIGQALGLESGQGWGDRPHFQLPDWKN